MRATLIFGLTFLVFFCATAQFVNKASLSLTLSGNAQSISWVDLDNDSLPDAVILQKKNTYTQLVAVRYVASDSAQTFLLADSINVAAMPVFLDWDGDNRIDMLFTQPGSTNLLQLINLGSFKFKKNSLPVGNTPPALIRFADLNNDGQPEALAIKQSGGWSILKNNRGQFNLVSDSADFAEDLVAFDFDGNGFRDIALSGTRPGGQSFLWVYQFINNFQVSRKIILSNPVSGKIAIGDVNEDGRFDLLVSGKNSSGQWVSQVYLNHDSTFVPSKKTLGLQTPELLIADLDSDGKADLSFFGSDAGGSRQRWIATGTGDSISLGAQHLTHLAYGDYDRDGDLDLLVSTDTLSVAAIENTTATKNYGPDTPLNSSGTFIFNRFFMYWDSAADDHTAAAALTYDVILLANQKETEAGEFDSKNFERLTVTHGNRGTDNFALMQVPISPDSYYLQSIDNSFTVNRAAHGMPGGGCNVTPQMLTSCKDVPIVLQSRQPALWFSFAKGFLGKKQLLTIPATPDTLFSFSPSKSSCDALNVYLVRQAATDTLKINKKFIGCMGDTTTFTIDPEWTGIAWNDSQGIQRASGNTVHYTVNKTETLTALGHNTRGCVLRETEKITLSRPVLVVNGDDFKLMQGQRVSLAVEGAREYWWQPTEGLSSSTSPTPEASPIKTTRYTVTGFDSLRCTATATVLIEVTNTAFIPTLFTPNGDGKNDELKIYGLSDVNDFQFSIYNREGSVVYETSDVGSATATGWDGIKSGAPQPSGLYYWKVAGHFDNGQALTLNGKTKGSIMLIR